MSKESKKPTEQPATQENTEEKIQLEELRKECIRLFGVTSSTFAGATADLDGSEYSVSEIGQHIETWKKKEVK